MLSIHFNILIACKHLSENVNMLMLAPVLLVQSSFWQLAI